MRDFPTQPPFGEQFRLYVDESGDHVFKQLDEPGHRFLCVLGCWFRGGEYHAFHRLLEEFKHRHFPHNPDEPPLLHRADIVNCRGCFWRLRDKKAAEDFDRELIDLIGDAAFHMCAVVVDKRGLQELSPVPPHPYDLAMEFLLQRYCGFLNQISRFGDVMAESRGGREDQRLKESYRSVYKHGVWKNSADFFQRCLTTKELKVKPKSANTAGLQLADILAHPVRQTILVEKGLASGPLPPFAEKLRAVLEEKFNRDTSSGQVWGYGKVLLPE